MKIRSRSVIAYSHSVETFLEMCVHVLLFSLEPIITSNYYNPLLKKDVQEVTSHNNVNKLQG